MDDHVRTRSANAEIWVEHPFVPSLKVFRHETVCPGFKKAWQGRNYATIINVAEKVPEKVRI